MTLSPYNKMPKELKQQWIDALRNGNYLQSRNRLFQPYVFNNQGGYCCLGVLQHSIDGKVEYNSDGKSCLVPTEDWLKEKNISFGWIDQDTDRFYSQAAPLFKIKGYDKLISATQLNDNEGYTFEEIANIVEDQIEGI
jgi:hypothetical protein